MRYIALFRGINVGGNTMIKMVELRAMLEALGFVRVASYINSGNLAFDSKKTAETTLETRIEAAVRDHIGKEVAVMVRRQPEISEILANNPFEGAYGSHKEMHVLFLKNKLSKDQERELENIASEAERFSVSGTHIYCHLPMGVADSVLGRGLFEKKLNVSVTARNWRTVTRLAEL